MCPPAIETTGLRKEFGDVVAVDGVDLVVESGEVFGFLGPNGAGKSTTIDVLLDFVRPTAGEVRVLGHDPQAEPRAVRERIGVLPEASGFYSRDTARDHLRFAAAMKRADDDPDALLKRVGLADAADRAVGGFSKGMRQRLGLAVALVGAPELLILDEPLGGLDPSGARRLREIVRAESERGAAVFFSSHIMDQVESVCDRVGIMHDGELVAVDTVEALRTSGETPAEVVLTVDGDSERAARRLRGVDGVDEVAVRDGRVRLTCTDPTAKADAVARLDAEGVVVRDVEADAPSLEQVFMVRTGQR
ncbi:ABC transporter ATP-binding protein [Halorarius halobius]|uniref:ABC transporter ATP-binding protein n=1 Tax=Halorarius halobius TaxID=2962671 RepID=UPI0020CDB697|nr:ABC transporter ATP-binding protein [Halorarius halobius]